MPLTQLQARDRYIISSMIQFMGRNIKTAYDIEAAATSIAVDPAQRFVTPLTLLKGKPDDLSVVRAAPSIAIDAMGSGERDRFYEMGSTNIWRHRSYLLSCFPSLDANGAPCDVAHELLRSYVQNAFETEVIKVVDYSNVLCNSGNIIFANDVMYIDHVSDPIDRGQTTALAAEKHRFDAHVTVKYVVAAVLNS